MERTYAKVLWKLSHQPGADTGALLKRLTEHLESTGRMKLLPRILRELKAIEARDEGVNTTIEVANESDAKEALAFAASLGASAEVELNPSLISGWRVKANGTLTDRSGKRALIELYRKVTTA
ncbi:MAG: F0F1 ATP synthase subunit delta [Patescibacteria group bacterium]